MEENFDIKQLRSEINAQTEAYVEFSNALLRIFELQSEIKADIERIATADATQVRDLFEKLASLSELVRVYTETQKENNQIVSDEMEEYNAVLSHFGSELERFKDKIEHILLDGAKTDTTNREAMEELVNGLETKLESKLTTMQECSDKMKQTVDGIQSKVSTIAVHFDTLKKAQTGLKEWKKKALWVSATLAAVWAILQGLVSLGVMEPLKFFPKSTVQQAAPMSTGSMTNAANPVP